MSDVTTMRKICRQTSSFLELQNRQHQILTRVTCAHSTSLDNCTLTTFLIQTRGPGLTRQVIPSVPSIPTRQAHIISPPPCRTAPQRRVAPASGTHYRGADLRDTVPPEPHHPDTWSPLLCALRNKVRRLAPTRVTHLRRCVVRTCDLLVTHRRCSQ